MNLLSIDIIRKILWYLDSKSYISAICSCKKIYSAKIHLNLEKYKIFIPPYIKYINALSELVNYIGFNGKENLYIDYYDTQFDIKEKLNLIKISPFYENCEPIYIENDLNTDTLIYYNNEITLFSNYIKKIYCTSITIGENITSLDYLECCNFYISSINKNICIKTIKFINYEMCEIAQNTYIYSIDHNRITIFPKTDRLILYGFNKKYDTMHDYKNVKKIVFEKCTNDFIFWVIDYINKLYSIPIIIIS